MRMLVYNASINSEGDQQPLARHRVVCNLAYSVTEESVLGVTHD